MKKFYMLPWLIVATLVWGVANAAPTMMLAQTVAAISDEEALKLSALEALMTAPSERALPLVRKVLAGNNSHTVKERALFVLGQLRSAEAGELLANFATDKGSKLQLEAIRMMGIRGDDTGLKKLAGVYRSGDEDVRGGVLQAYLIAGRDDLVFDIARQTKNDEEFSAAVNTLAAMGATDALRRLGDQAGTSESLLQAYAISGDLDSILRVARDSSDTELRLRAIRNIGIVGGSEANDALVNIYQEASGRAEREAVVQGLLISGHDEGLLVLYRSSKDPADKRKILQTLVHMNSDLAFDLIDSALEGDK